MNKFSHSVAPALFLLSGLLAACASTPPPPPPKPVDKPVVHKAPADPFKHAGEKFAAGDWASALSAYDAILAKEPKNVSARFNRAVTLERLGRTAEAKTAYEGILADEPEHEESVINLGAVLRAEGKGKDAIALYSKFLKAHPWKSRVLNNLAVLHREAKQYDKAIEMVRTLLMRDQNNVDAYKNLALVYFDQGKHKLAQTILGNALQMAEKAKLKDPDIHVNLGLTHLALGKKEAALVSFKEAASIDPSHIVANYNIGAIALEHRDYALAERSFGVAIRKYGEEFEANAALGYAYQGLQRYDDAITRLTKAHELNPQDEQVILQTIVIYQAMNKVDDALSWAQRYMQQKGLSCTEEDFEGFCGRYNGIKLMKQMASQPAPVEEKKPKNDGSVELFTGGEEEAPAEGEVAPEGNPEATPEAAPEPAPAEAPSSGGGAEPEAQ